MQNLWSRGKRLQFPHYFKTMGNQIWEVMTPPCGGRPPHFKKPEELWAKFQSYCKWVDEHPWTVKQGMSSVTENDFGNIKSNRQGVAVKQRAYTLYGFCAYAGVYKWGDLKRSYIKKKGFPEVLDAIETVVISQQLDGALLHQFDSNLVARINGMADKQITEITDTSSLPKLSSSDIDELKRLNGC